jgi:hypothetical protein
MARQLETKMVKDTMTQAEAAAALGLRPEIIGSLISHGTLEGVSVGFGKPSKVTRASVSKLEGEKAAIRRDTLQGRLREGRPGFPPLTSSRLHTIDQLTECLIETDDATATALGETIERAFTQTRFRQLDAAKAKKKAA